MWLCASIDEGGADARCMRSGFSVFSTGGRLLKGAENWQRRGRDAGGVVCVDSGDRRVMFDFFAG
jgi:hypothetical protein